VTATAPARIYNLAPRKGAIAIGADADIAIWNPEREVALADEIIHDRTGYTPYAGRRVKGWPEVVLRRGVVIIEGGRMLASAGSGKFLPRSGGQAAAPTGRLEPEMDPAKNFGARLF
jgi:dihydropyrimidinase